MWREIDLGRGLLALGTVAVLVGLFLGFFDVGGNGWEVFETLDLVIAGLALGGAVPLLHPPAEGSTLRLLPFGLLVVLLVQLLEPPPAAVGGDPDAGLWIALGGALAMVIGTVLSLARISVRIDLSERERRRSEAAAVAADAPAAGAPEAPGAADGSPKRSRFARAEPQASEPVTSVAPEPVREVPAVDRRPSAPQGDKLDETQPLDPQPE